MIFWVTIGALSLLTAISLTIPLVWRSTPQMPSGTYDAEICHQQLERINRDVELGLVSQDEHSAARMEVQRRLLRIQRADQQKNAPPAYSVIVLLLTVFLVPSISVSSYLYLGAPGLPDTPLASRGEEIKQAKQLKQINEMVNRLSARMEQNPDDAKGWEMLGRSYKVLGDFDNSSIAYSKAYELNPDKPDLALQYAEALIFREEGYVSPDARKVLEVVLSHEPASFKARFYYGMALSETAAELPKAIEIWERLVMESPEGSPWLTSLKEHLKRAREMVNSEG